MVSLFFRSIAWMISTTSAADAVVVVVVVVISSTSLVSASVEALVVTWAVVVEAGARVL